MNGNKRSVVTVATVAVLFAGIGGGTGYWLASHRTSVEGMAAAANPAANAAQGRKVLYWYDPMVPNQHFDKPGKSPFMDMQLVAKYADEGGDAASIKIDPSVTQNLGLRLAKVERGTLAAPVAAVGNVQWNERQVAVVQARTAGFVERVYGRAPGDVIATGAPLADLLVPDWAGAQTEFLALRSSGDAALTQAARERLKLLGMPAELIAQVESTGQVHPLFTVTSPVSGVIQTLDVRAGMSLAAGMPLAKINGLNPVWLEAAVPEALAGKVGGGTPVSASLAAYPGQRLTGKVIAVLPETNLESRTVRVRVELANHDGRLRAGMFAQINLTADNGAQALLVPSEAVIRTGTRNVVLLSLDGGRFQPVEVKLGQEAGGKIAVLDGLREGQSVVASGQFLIDSEASLKGVLARLSEGGGVSPAAQPAASAASTLNEADGKVESISGNEITLSHGPVKSLGWGAMTMPFQLARPNLLAGVKPGDRVHFGFRQGDGGYVLEQIGKTGSAP
ncbi:efflux RND transporter periplasmic adaptor subunit [Chitinivorax sp. PXF-14]|uniref:efflux RND transporter periplasmic adaptor subunit n=1 Tax=Chitinivorax sp. PXF-14 TaxID=3230488 RepID=UPI0034665FC2